MQEDCQTAGRSGKQSVARKHAVTPDIFDNNASHLRDRRKHPAQAMREFGLLALTVRRQGI